MSFDFDSWSKGWFRQLSDNPMWAKVRTGLTSVVTGEPVFYKDGPGSDGDVDEVAEPVVEEPVEDEPVKPARRSTRKSAPSEASE